VRWIVALGCVWLPAPAAAFALTIGGGVPAMQGNIALGEQSPFANDAGVVTEDFATASGCGVSKVTANGPMTIGSKSTLNRRREPTNDTSCYLAAGTSALNTSVTLSLPVPTGKRIDYLGFYWGSIDPYNFLSFANGAGAALPLGSFGFEIDGNELATSPKGPALFSSSFVAFSFTIGEVVRSLTLRQTNFAFEIDNLSYRLIDVFPAASAREAHTVVSEPASAVPVAVLISTVLLLRRRIMCHA